MPIGTQGSNKLKDLYSCVALKLLDEGPAVTPRPSSQLRRYQKFIGSWSLCIRQLHFIILNLVSITDRLVVANLFIV